jgi:hypothetical protein
MFEALGQALSDQDVQVSRYQAHIFQKTESLQLVCGRPWQLINGDPICYER